MSLLIVILSLNHETSFARIMKWFLGLEKEIFSVILTTSNQGFMDILG